MSGATTRIRLYPRSPIAVQTKCESMITAFAAGGDFHSRTAMGMYPHVAEAVRKGDVLLEVDDGAPGSAPKPLLKNVYGSERKKAKVSGLKHLCMSGVEWGSFPWTQCSCSGLARRWLLPGAQILNFSIAYGKTAHGLASDWNVTVEEAKDTLDKWYKDRPEVRSLPRHRVGEMM